MAEGERAYLAQELEPALRAFTLAHAHFERLESRVWAHRAAANAAACAFFWGDLRAQEAWQALSGPQPSPFKELETLALRAARGEWQDLESDLRRILKAFPECEQAWNLLAEGGLSLDRPEWIREALPHLTHPDVQSLMQARLDGWKNPAPAHLQPEQRLSWTLPRTLRGLDPPAAFWAAWAACSNHLMRLEAALDLLEALPAERTAQGLLDLQAIAERAQVSVYLGRLKALWPEPGVGPTWAPRALVQVVLERGTTPLWLGWGTPREWVGRGAEPPPGLLQRLHEDGALAPTESGGHLWWGFPLLWAGAPVAHALVGLEPGEPLEAPLEAGLLAPWLAQLAPPVPAEPMPLEGELLADGSEPMASVLRELDRVAPSSLSVLILGPTGSGKELAARELHRRSKRPGKLVPINCAAFTENLLESELFGHVKGAFTGAVGERPGAIETASGGTLFLDEVVDLSPKLQSMLLRVLQEREVRKVGSDRAVRIDVRFVAATHRSLDDLIHTGAFRKDLLYRLQGTVLSLPSLAERRHEFPYLLPKLISLVAREARRDAPVLAPGLAQALRRLAWAGNFRELRHALERAMLRCGDGPLTTAHFPELEAPELDRRTWEDATRAFQRKLLLDTLRQHGFKAAEAAKALGLARPALYNTAKRLGVDLLAEREK
jgi:transcriptional regulator with AAA-type ATPase domain